MLTRAPGVPCPQHPACKPPGPQEHRVEIGRDDPPPVLFGKRESGGEWPTPALLTRR